ncbi:MAG: hypothetical protein PHT12_02410 [Patescibacteria group bacterium]|nr:hypothetical protein [Patescibacteria group bacterium]
MELLKLLKNHSRITFEQYLRIFEVSAVFAGVVFAGVQLNHVRLMQSAQLMLSFNEDLNSEKNSKIIYAVEEGLPVFQENGGQFNANDVDKYLSVYELLNNARDAGLITDDMMYNAFSFSLMKTHQNKEIEDYIIQQRMKYGEPLLFDGYERLAKSVELIN